MLKKYTFYAIFIRNFVDDDECHIRLGYKFEVDDMYELGDSLIPSMFNFDGYDKKFVLITGKRDKNVEMVEYAAYYMLQEIENEIFDWLESLVETAFWICYFLKKF